MSAPDPPRPDQGPEPLDLAAAVAATSRAVTAGRLQARPKRELLDEADRRGLTAENVGRKLETMTKAELVRLLYGGTEEDHRAHARRIVGPEQ